MQYLIRHITDSTNHTFTEVIKPRENERYEIVSAESKAEAEEIAKESMQCPYCESWNTEYEYLYVNNIPIYLAFNCNNCNERYGKELVGDEKGFSIKLKDKDSDQ